MSNVRMVFGFPASGKSTLTKDFVAQGYTSLNRDTEGGTIVGLLPKMEQLLKDGKKIVLDNLFAKAETRKPFIDLAKQYGQTISCSVMGTSIEDAQFNAVQRMIDLTGSFPSLEEIKKSKHPNIFPVVVLFKYKKEYEKPTVEEGFDTIETIKFVRKENPAFTNKALILDYDGTLRECIGGNGKFPVSEEQIEIKSGRTKIIDEYRARGYHILGVSNQSGVAKGELTYDKATALFQHTNKLLGTEIDFTFCPHQSAPPNCYCRKPQVGFGVEFINKYKLNRKECIFVGDLKTDETFSKRCGFKFIHAEEFFK